MYHVHPVVRTGLTIAVATFLLGCSTVGTPPDRVWPAETPGSYPGRTQNTRSGEWWFPSEIGPKEVPPQGGNRGTIFYLSDREAPPPQVVQRVVYKTKYVDRVVKVERLFFPAIQFDQESARLNAEAEAQVHQAAQAIEKAGDKVILVVGHTDVGESAKLDMKRGNTVRAELIRLGISGDRLVVEGHGSTQLLSTADTAIGHALNRRVVFTFLPPDLDLDPKGPEDEPMPRVGPNTIVETVEKTVTVARPRLEYLDRLIFPNILFDYDKANLRPEGVVRADRAAAIVKALDNVRRVTVVGHCDSRGSDSYNDSLSGRRAATVRDHLVRSSVAPSILASQGQGERQPIATNDTDEGRQLNRRVEFLVEYTD